MTDKNADLDRYNKTKEQQEVIKQLEEMFLSIPVPKAVLASELEEQRKTRAQLFKTQFLQAQEILDATPSGKDFVLEGYWVLWLFNTLQTKAYSELDKYAALAQTTKPAELEKYGIPKDLIDNTLVQLNRKSGGKKTAAISNINKAKRLWDEWQNNSKKYATQKAFIQDVLNHKFCKDESTVRRWIRKWRGGQG